MVKHRSFIDKQMIFMKFSVSLSETQKLGKNWKFDVTNGPPMVYIAKNHSYLPSGGHISWQFFSFSLIFDFLIKIQKIYDNIICLSIKDLCLTKNLKCLAQKLGLPRPWQVQNWNGCGGLNFWATTSKGDRDIFLFRDIFDCSWALLSYQLDF